MPAPGHAPKLMELFSEAVEFSTTADRDAYLDRMCGEDRLMRDRVEGLLGAHANSEDFLEAPAPPPTIAHEPTRPAEGPGAIIGPYKLLEQIGEGGMGAVYMAEQVKPVRRAVALKIIKPGMDSKQVIARFEAERQALAMMDHPNIARVLDAGTTESGLPYFVMELVRGIPITDFCDRENLPVAARLELFVLVCRAIQHAHQKGIIHRDIKPSNVLVTLHDGVPVPKVIDFGIAKATGASLTDRTLHTGFAQLVGTPMYMSPEQAELSGLDIDTRSDIYSLGVLLYELLTGTTPFDGETLRKAAFDEMRRMIREDQPPTPSTRLSSLGEAITATSARRSSDPRHLNRSVRGELDWIAMKALEKDRRRRYETANDFAADVMRYLTDRPVEAGPPSARYRFKKFAWRNRAALTTTGLVASFLVAGITLGTVLIWNEKEATKRALTEAKTNFATAKANFALSQEHLGLARQAVDEMYTDVAQYWLKNQSHATPIQKEFAEKALAFYRRFAEKPGSTPEERRKAADAAIRAAEILGFLGRSRDAEALYERSITLMQALVREFPGDAGHRRTLSDTHVLRGRLRAESGLLGPAEDDFRRALEIDAVLAAERPDDPAARENWSRSYLNLGTLLLDVPDRLAESERLLRRAFELDSQQAAAFPKNPDYKWNVAKIHSSLASVLEALNRLDESERESRAALTHLNVLSSAFPGIVDLRTDLAGAHQNYGRLLRRMGRFKEGEVELREAMTNWADLSKRFPDLPQYRLSLANTQEALGRLLGECGRFEEANRPFEDATLALTKLRREFPDIPAYRMALADLSLDRGKILRKAGKPDEAEAFLREAVAGFTELDRNPAAPRPRQSLLDAVDEYGSFLREKGRAAEAEEMRRTAIPPEPRRGGGQ